LIFGISSLLFGQQEHDSLPDKSFPYQPAIHEGHRIYVKFNDGLNIRLRNGKLTDFGAGILQTMDSLIALGQWQRVHRLDEETLEQLRQKGEARRAKNKGMAKKDNRNGRLPDLNLEFYFYPKDTQQLQSLLTAFNRFSIVEKALPTPKPVRPPFNRNLQDRQGYLNQTTDGIGATPVWNRYGIYGQGVKFVDIEYSFDDTHFDLPNVQLVNPLPSNDPYGPNHGTAVLGQVVGLANDVGVTGIAYQSKALFSTALTQDNIWNFPAAVTDALPLLEAGDVMLIEQQTGGPRSGVDNEGGQFGLVPMEWFEPFYNALVLAVSQGIVVVEAAGNGGQNLDDPIFRSGNAGHYPFNIDGDVHSGCLMVGAAKAPENFGGSGEALSRIYFSNYGRRLNLQGWGEAIYTAGYGDLNQGTGDSPNRFFTSSFGGTSGASPIVTGACLLLQSAAKQKNGSPLEPEEVLSYLQATGVHQIDGQYLSREIIGPYPNVYRALQLFYGDTIGCSGEQTLTALSGIITDGSGPQNYGKNANCTWTIAPPAAQAIRLEFRAFDVEPQRDWLAIYAGPNAQSKLVGRYSGTIPEVIEVPSNAVHIVFQSDGAEAYGGWEIHYTTIQRPCPPPTNLYAIETAQAGLRYFWENSNNANFIWEYRSNEYKPEPTIVAVNEYSSREELNTELPIIFEVVNRCGKFHYSEPVKYIREPGKKCEGLRTLIDAVGLVGDGSGNLPHFDFVNCQWLIKPFLNTNLTLEFELFDVAPDAQVWVYDGENTESKLLGMVSESERTFVCTSGNAFVVFESPGVNSMQQDGWYFRYTSDGQPVNCEPLSNVKAPTEFITQNSARITWDSLLGATVYTVRYKLNSDFNWRGNQRTTQNFIDLNSLRSDTMYIYDVTARCYDGRTTTPVLDSFRTKVKTSRQPLAEQHIRLWPNPNKGRFTIAQRYPFQQHQVAILHNMLGQAVYQTDLPAGQYEMEMDLPKMPPGIYALDVVGLDKSMHRHKMMIAD
jgi:hypothetical protein